MIRQSITIVFLSLSLISRAQQQATFSQYMFNGLAVNPAYAGMDELLTATAIARYQSLGLEGAPNTQTFAMHGPLLDKNIGVGLLFVKDKISVIDQYSISAAYAYRIKLTSFSTLSLGIQGGINTMNAQYTQVKAQNPYDPAFQADVQSTRPNFGMGVYYKTRLYYAGISLPQMANNVFTRGPDLTTVKQDNPVILTGGLEVPISRAVVFKPSALVKVVAGKTVEMDFNAQFSFDDVVWIGSSVTMFHTVDILLQLKLTRQLRFGYAYMISTNEIRTVELGSHELMVSYRFEFPPKEGLVSPRAF